MTMASYVYGNTARKYNTAPKYQPEEQPAFQPEKQQSQQVKKKQKNALHMNRGYVIFLTVAAIAALFVCIQYLQLQAEVTARSSNVTALQRTLETKKEVNSTKYNLVMDSVDLEVIRDRAMNELGMVYAAEGQIVRYKDPARNAVTQYTSIPESGVIPEQDVE